MIRKLPAKAKKPRPLSRKKLHALYPSLAQGPTPEERLEQLLAQEKGPTPKTPEEWDRWLEKYKGVWPDEKEIDEFLAWLKEARRTGRYG